MKKIITGIIAFLAFLTLLVIVNPSIIDMAEITYLNMIKTTKFEVKENAILMNGEINSKTFADLKKVVSENPKIKKIILKDVPGSLDDESNLKMMNWVREKGFVTHLEKDSHVASGGADFFLAGVERTMEKGAKIGVHSWTDGEVEAKDLPKDHKLHQGYVKYTKKMLGTDDFYWFTINVAGANEIYYMTKEDIDNYKLLTKPVIN